MFEPRTDTDTDPSASTTPVLTADGDEAITARRFACETHDAPGSCDVECARLIAAMSATPGVDYDPTGCSYGPPRQYQTYTFDADTAAVIETTYTPLALLDDATYARLLD